MVNVSKGLFSVAGKTALITGGGSGIGGFMAQSLADGGATILLVGRREDLSLIHISEPTRPY